MRNQISYQDQNPRQKSPTGFILRVAMCILVLFTGVLGMSKLASLKKPPAELAVEERPIRVDVVKVEPQDYPVTLTAYGDVKALTNVAIASEVAGRVIATHPRLDVGEIIPAGEILFEVDDTNYRATVNEAKSAVAQLKSAITRLNRQYQVDKQRLESVRRNLELSKADFERTRKLYEESRVGSRSGVEMAEKAFMAVQDQAIQVNSMVDLYPLQIKEAKTNMETAEARMNLALANLDRCKVRAPFTGRLALVNVEKDLYVAPGAPVLSLVNDSILEIRVAIDSQDAQKWLRFTENPYAGNESWFSGLEPVPCKVRWTEMNKDAAWEGNLHRVVQFDPLTRTVTLAIRIPAENARPQGKDGLPLVEGMFCEVQIPGRTLQSVYKLPRWAVTFRHDVYVAQNSRLKTQKVDIIRSEGDTVYVSSGLNPGDNVIVTRLVDPLENALLDISSKIPIEESESSEPPKEDQS